jgi:FemAB-related protein (PEP-CTERM system-associated)
MTSNVVSILDRGEEPAWDAFVAAHTSSTFFHLSGWRRVIERAFRHKTFYLTARRNGDICGVLPLTQIRSILFGNYLISNAFCVRGGPIAANESAATELRAEAVRIARELKVGHIEFRSTGDGDPSWQVRSGLYANFQRGIVGEAEFNLKAIPRKQRAMVRKGIGSGLQSEIDRGVGRLHHIYAESVRNLGTPVFSRRYFQLLQDEFGENCEILTVLDRARPIASVMSFIFRDTVIPYYGGGTKQARKLAGNDFMYWEVMRRAGERGLRQFDFGRSKIGTGAFDFKRNWGFEPRPLSYEYLPVNSSRVPDVNPLNPKYRHAIGLWRRMPVFATKLLGPAIVRSIG